MSGLIPNEVGTWIECCNRDCKKWRYSIDFDDPLAVPEKWFCYMNSDPSTNTCSAPESLDLEEDEIFILSKFKAGSIVWAKVIGYPWCPGMIDFCPEFEAYYWIDNVGSNVPTQYHVTFLAGNQVTRAWIKNAFIKPFVGNEDPSFALKSRIRGKKLTLCHREEIIEGCKFAKAALRLSLAGRLKKYNFNSWRLAQRFQQLERHSSERRAKKHQFGDRLPRNLVKPKAVKTKKPSRTKAKELVPNICEPNKSSRQQKSIFVAPVNHDDLRSDTSTLEDTTSNTENTQNLDDTRSINSVYSKDFSESLMNVGRSTADKKQVVELRVDGRLVVDVLTDKRFSNEKITEIVTDALQEIIPNSQNSTPKKRTRSKIVKEFEKADTVRSEKQLTEESSSEKRSKLIEKPTAESFKNEGSQRNFDDARTSSSICSEDSAETSLTKARFTAIQKQVVELRIDGRRMVDILTDNRLSNYEMADIVTEALDEALPFSKDSSPRKRSINKTAKGFIEEVDIIGNHKQLREDSDVEIVAENLERVPKTSDSLSLRMKSKTEGKIRKSNDMGQKAASENLMRIENKENNPEESRYLRALSEFTLTEKNPLPANYQSRRPAARKPLPTWFSNKDQRRKSQAERFDRLLSKLSNEEDGEMYRKNRESFIAEMEAAEPSKARNVPTDLKPTNYFVEKQNYDNLLTSDEDSF